MSADWQEALEDAWSELTRQPTETRQYRTRRLSHELGLDAFAAVRSADNAPCLIIDAEVSPETLFEVGGMRLSVAAGDPDPLLVLSLEDSRRMDLFATLCADAISASTDIAQGEELSAFLARLDAWRRFLRERHSGLSREETIGLLGELIVLESLLAHASSACPTWVSPDDGLHDFHNHGYSLEVKTSLGPSSRIRISSVDQLATEGLDQLDLLHVRLIESADGRSIEMLLADIMPQLPDYNSRRALDNALLRRGLMPDDNPARTRPRVQLRSLDCYRIDDKFPRIVRSDLPAGVLDATYVVDLQAIAPRACDSEEVLESFCGRAAA
jgi:hypothetical protein